MTDLELADIGLAAMKKATPKPKRVRKPVMGDAFFDIVAMHLAIGVMVGFVILALTGWHA